MAKWGMTIDLDRCTACQACVTACQAENNLPPTGPDESRQGRNYTWMEMIHFGGEGERPKAIERLLPRPCFHCDNPPCVKVCPVGEVRVQCGLSRPVLRGPSARRVGPRR